MGRKHNLKVNEISATFSFKSFLLVLLNSAESPRTHASFA